MRVNTAGYRDIVRLADHTAELAQLGQCNDDDRIDRAFAAVCKRIWGYTLDDFDDDSLSPKDHTFLDRLTGKQACKFARENGYDLVDPGTGHMVPIEAAEAFYDLLDEFLESDDSQGDPGAATF